jgi:hypothetical protein
MQEGAAVKAVKANPPYVPLTQQEYCCFATCVQMILSRRKMKLFSQEEIGRALCLTVPKSAKKLFNKVRAGKKPKTGYGTQESKKGCSLNAFFNKKKIPLKCERYWISKVEEPAKFIVKNLRRGNDVVALYHNRGINPKGKAFGHACIVSEITLGRRPEVVLIDPDFRNKKYNKVGLGRLCSAMSTKYDGNERGFWVICKK